MQLLIEKINESMLQDEAGVEYKGDKLIQALLALETFIQGQINAILYHTRGITASSPNLVFLNPREFSQVKFTPIDLASGITGVENLNLDSLSKVTKKITNSTILKKFTSAQEGS